MAQLKDTLLADLLAQEHKVWNALQRGDAKADMALLSPNFIGVYTDGFATRDDHAAQLRDGPSIASYQISDVRVQTIENGHALLCYRADFKRIGRTVDQRMYVTSMWQRSGSGWINVFSQDTPAIEGDTR